MEKMRICRICRSEKNLKYTTKELRLLNKQQLLLAQAAQQGQENSRASKKLLLTTPTLGNICRECDERLQIFHRLDDDDADHDSCSDIEVDVVNNTTNNITLPSHRSGSMSKENALQRKQQRPETPVIVDDNDMLYNIFMQKIDQQRQFRNQHQTDTTIMEQQNQHFVNQFHTSYTPPQSSAGGSEGDESKVIEILTSRESTPSFTIPAVQPQAKSSLVDQQGHRIVAIIELDDCEESESKNTVAEDKNSILLTPVTNCSNDLSFTESHDCGPNTQTLKSQNCPKQLEDDEEIVFRKVDSEKDNFSTLKKRKRKSYDDKQLRLVASLSLVSSDSETEEEPVKKVFIENESKISKNLQNSITCEICQIKFPDSESLSVHERIHQGEKCIMCPLGFSQTKRLIHHMRHKHRSYNGNVLSEKPRSGQDSCMTIRLRYMQSTTFYECQLCGRIDEIFKEHKVHIMEKHASESKSLKDPMMKQLKCPICKAKCGAQYLSLCRHLISTHEYQQYKSHLRELVHVSAFGWSAARQYEVAKTAKIFQFVKRKTFFFECKICRKVVAGYLHHLRHVNNHKESINDNSKADCPSKISKEFLEEDLNKTNVNDAVEEFETSKTKQTSKDLLKTKKENTKKGTKKMLKTYKINKSNSNLLAKPKSDDTEAKSSEYKTKIQIQIKLKPKDTVKNKQSVVKLTKARPKKNTGSSKNKDNEKRKPIKGKRKDNVQKPQVVKVKVKPPIRQIELQKFKCNYCLKKFKGFRMFNLHLLQQHKDNEYIKCLICNKTFKNCYSTLEEHKKHCTIHVSPLSKRKSQIAKTCLILENCNESSKREVPETCKITNNIENNNNYQWLQDLLKLNAVSRVSDNSFNTTALYTNNNYNNINLLTNFQCCYCLHLFTDENTLNKHTKERHSQKDDIFIKYKPIKIMNT